MLTAVRGTLQFSSRLQLMPGLVELHGEPEDWPDLLIQISLGEFYLVYWPRKCYCWLKGDEIARGGPWKGQGFSLCHSCLNWLKMIMKPWLMPGKRRWLLCLGIHLWPKVACLFQRQQHGPFLSLGCVLDLCEWVVFHISPSTVFLCVTKPWPSDKYSSHTQPVVKRRTNIYFKSTRKGKYLTIYSSCTCLLLSISAQLLQKVLFAFKVHIIPLLLGWCWASAYLFIRQILEAIFLLIIFGGQITCSVFIFIHSVDFHC